MKISLSTAAFVAMSAIPAAATTITISDFSAASYQAAVGTGPTTVENFEGFSEGVISSTTQTAVGYFETVGGTGSGGTVSQSNFSNDGTELTTRDGNVFGRTSTTSALSGDNADDTFLDSNDTNGIEFTAYLGGTLFNQIVLTLTDSAEFRTSLEVVAGNATTLFLGGSNGQTRLVTIEFDQAVETASIFFNSLNASGTSVRNDGFSLDDIAVSEVPLPASALLLLAGLGGLGAYGRRKQA